jgi:hypothetical protein
MRHNFKANAYDDRAKSAVSGQRSAVSGSADSPETRTPQAEVSYSLIADS